MKRHHPFVVATAFILCTASAFAQKKPDFSGRWVAVSPADAAGEEQIVKQDSATLTISHGAEGPAHVFTYDLSGKETRLTMPSHGHEIVTHATAAWDGDRLVIAQKSTYPDGRELNQKLILSLDAHGQLVVEVTETMTGRPTETRKVICKRK